MSQEKDDKSKATASPGSKPGMDPSADASKRPYATIDLKATEVAGDKTAVPKAGSSASASTASGPTSKPAEPAKAPTATAASAPASLPPKSTASPTATTSAAAPARSSALSTWLPSLVSGAAGAVLALLGLGSMGLIGGDANNTALADRLAALEKAAATTAPPSADIAKQVAAADARLAAIESSTREMAKSQATLTAEAKALDARMATQTPAAAAAVEKVGKLEAQLAELANAANNDPQRGRIPALAQITTKLGELDTQLTTRTSGLKSELSQEMERRLAKSDETAEAARARLAQRTQSLEQTLKSVSDDTTALRASVDGLKNDLEARFKTAAKPADVAAAVEPVTTKMAGLEKNLANVVRSEQDRNATAGNILLSIELNNLKRAIDRGGKYTSELAAVKKVGGDKLNLSVLESAQASGVPSLAVLTTEFRALAYTMLDAEAEPDQGSVMDRLLASAKSVVRIRKVAHSPGDKSTEAIVGRMEDSLKEGRLGDVLDYSKTLGGKPLAAAASWLKKIEARHEIETALTGLEQSLKNALAGSADIKKGAN